MSPVAIILLTLLGCFILYLVIRVSFWSFWALSAYIQDEGNNDFLRLLVVIPWLCSIVLVFFWMIVGALCTIDLLRKSKNWWNH